MPIPADSPRAGLRPHILAVSFLLLYCIGVNFQFLLGRMPYQDDAGRETIPQMRHYGQWLRQGRLPLWNNDLGSGYYQHASGQSAMFYPPNLILYRLLDWSTAYRASLILHTFAACFWLYLLGLALGLRKLPSVFLALCIGGGGVIAAHQIHINIVMGISHAFAILWVATQWLRRDRPWPWALAGAVILGLSLLGGQPQYVSLALLMVIIYALVAWRTANSALCGIGSILGRGALVLVGGILLGAVQVVPLYYYSRMFPRPEPAGHYEFVTSGSFQWADFSRFILPAAGLKTQMGTAYWESLGYVGTAAILLAVLGLLTPRKWNLRMRYAVALIVIGTLLMLGSNTPLYHFLAHIPPFSIFRVPARYVLLLALGLVLLAADYMQFLMKSPAMPSSRVRTGATITAVAFLTAFALVHFLRSYPPMWLRVTVGDVLRLFPAIWLEAALTGLVLAAITPFILIRKQNSTRIASAAILCTLPQLALLWLMLNPTVPMEFWIDPPPAARLCLSRTTHTGEKVACLEPASPTYPPVDTPRTQVADWRDRLAANTCSVYGVPSALVGDAILPAAAMHTDIQLRRNVSDPYRLADFCTRLGIKWITMSPQHLGPPWIQPDPSRPYLYENPDAIGSFFVCEETVLGPGNFPRPAPVGGPYELQPVECRIAGPGEFLLDFTAPRRATLFIMQSHYPGWLATVDGQPIPLQLAHPGGFFMQMPVPAGTHQMRLSFEPWDYDIGLGLSIAAAVLMAMLLAFWLSARRRRAA